MLKIKNILIVIITACLAIFVSSCQIDAVQTLPNRNWELVWSDDFEGAVGKVPNPDNWVYDLGGGGWGNAEFQVYTNSTQNVALDGNGNLLITARRNPGPSYTSGRIKTKGKFEQKYGRFEARIKTPTGQVFGLPFGCLEAI